MSCDYTTTICNCCCLLYLLQLRYIWSQILLFLVRTCKLVQDPCVCKQAFTKADEVCTIVVMSRIGAKNSCNFFFTNPLLQHCGCMSWYYQLYCFSLCFSKIALKSIERLARFNGRCTAIVCPCSSWSLQQSFSSSPGAALPAVKHWCWFWRCILSGTSAFDSPQPWCFWLRHTWLSHRTRQGGREEMTAHILLLAQALTWCLWAGWSTGGQGNCFLIYKAFLSSMRAARAAANQKAMVVMYWYTVLLEVLHRFCTLEVLSLVLMSVGMAVVDLCVCGLGHLAPLF